MTRLYIMQGLPASGKSTKAEEIVSHGNTVRINKDLLRTMLHYDKFTGKNEDMTSQASLLLAEHFLMQGVNVVIDDTNLNPKTLEKYTNIHKMGFCDSVDIVRMYTSVDECIIRDIQREKSVGRDVIVKMALQYQEFLENETFVLCDLDGTLCDIKHRLKYARGPEKDWDKFFAGVPEDTLRQEVFDQVLEVCKKNNCRPIYVSARPERCRKNTEAWLEKNGANIQYLLLMRGDHDKRDDTLVKKEMYEKYLKHLNIVKVFDDRPKVIRMWRDELGLDVVDVGEGIEF